MGEGGAPLAFVPVHRVIYTSARGVRGLLKHCVWKQPSARLSLGGLQHCFAHTADDRECTYCMPLLLTHTASLGFEKMRVHSQAARLVGLLGVSGNGWVAA